MKQKAAVSTIVATILMINMAIVMGGIMIAWAMGLIGSYQGGTQIQYMLMDERVQEAITVECVWFESGPPKKITFFVRNIGVREAKLTTLYVNGTSYTPNGTWPYTLTVGSRVTLLVNYTWTSGAIYLITIATTRGNKAHGEWTP